MLAHNFLEIQPSTLLLQQSFPMTAPSPLYHSTPIRQPPNNFQGPQPSTLSLQPPLLMTSPYLGNQTAQMHQPLHPFQGTQPSTLSAQPSILMTASYPVLPTAPFHNAGILMQQPPYIQQPLLQSAPIHGYQTAGTCVHPSEIWQPGAKQPLVNFKEFADTFAIPFMYGDITKPWPKKTILLYKYSSNSNYKYSEIPENTWKRRDNKQRKHAEKRMIEDLENIQQYIEMQPDYCEGNYKFIHSIEVIQSYSPCSDCSDKLCSFKEKIRKNNFTLDPQNTDCVDVFNKINFKISFSNFYKHIENLYPGTGSKNMKGLKKLSDNGIDFDVFTDDNWHEFPNIDLYRSCLENPFRKIRQDYDKKIRQELEKL